MKTNFLVFAVLTKLSTLGTWRESHLFAEKDVEVKDTLPVISLVTIWLQLTLDVLPKVTIVFSW